MPEAMLWRQSSRKPLTIVHSMPAASIALPA